MPFLTLSSNLVAGDSFQAIHPSFSMVTQVTREWETQSPIVDLIRECLGPAHRGALGPWSPPSGL